MDENSVLFPSLEDELRKVLTEQAETELDIRRGELTVKKINAIASLQRAKLDLMKLQLEQKRVELEDRRLSLDEFNMKFRVSEEMSHKSDKIQRVISKTMLGIFPEQDKQIVSIMKAAQKIGEMKK